MRAALLTEIPAVTLRLDDLSPAPLGRGDVRVAVSACGICGTDLHVMAGESYQPELPFVLGHECVGNVVEVGDRTHAQWLGQRVVPTLFAGCRQCVPCRVGDERLCERGASILGVLGRHGGFADLVTIPAAHLVAVPEMVGDEVAAGLVDAGTTARNAVRVAVSEYPYNRVRTLIIGGGPIGLLAAGLLRLAAVETVVVEANVARRELLAGRSFSVVSEVDSLNAEFSVVIDCAGDPALVRAGLELLRPRGRYICVGYGEVPNLDLSVVAHRELSIHGIRSGSRRDLEEVLALVAEGALCPPPVETWPLVEVNDALKALRCGRVAGKAVVVTG